MKRKDRIYQILNRFFAANLYKFVSFFLVFIATIGTIMVFFEYFSPSLGFPHLSLFQNTPTPTTTPKSLLTPTININSTKTPVTLNSLQDEINSIDNQINILSLTVNGINTNSINALNDRLRIIEKYVLDNPEKALSITLMEEKIIWLQKDLDRNNGLIIGVMIPLVLALIALVYGTFRKPPNGNNGSHSE